MKPDQMDPPQLPVKCKLTLLYAFSFVTAALLAVASLAGLLYPKSIYPDQDLLQSFNPSDVVHLVIGLPSLLAAIWLSRNG